MDDISNAVADDLASLEKKSAELGEQMGAMMEGQLKKLAAAQFASDETLAEQTAKMARVEHVIQTQLSDGLWAQVEAFHAARVNDMWTFMYVSCAVWCGTA